MIAVLTISQLGLAVWLFLISRRLHKMTTEESLALAVGNIQDTCSKAAQAINTIPAEITALIAKLPQNTGVGTVPDSVVLAAGAAIVDAARPLVGALEGIQAMFANAAATGDPTGGVV